MSGVGCGFALSSADLLANSFAGRSLAKADLKVGLDEYRQRYAEVIGPHIQGICADSLLGKNEAFRRKMFKTISDSPELSQKYLAITGRLLPPERIQSDSHARDAHPQRPLRLPESRPASDAPGPTGEVYLRGNNMSRVAFTTFAILKKPYGNPRCRSTTTSRRPPSKRQKAARDSSPGRRRTRPEPPDQLRAALG